MEEVDYEIDYLQGLITRTSGSRIPDWSVHALSGVTDFDHTLYADFSNINFTVYVDYGYEISEEKVGSSPLKQDGVDGLSERPSGKGADGLPLAQNEAVGDILLEVKHKLSRGHEVCYVVYGDSISTGGEASEESYTYFSRFAARLTELHPEGSFRIMNKAIGGETSEGGAERVISDVVSEQPDLVTIGYGMNDQNKFEHGNGVSLPEYEHNIRFMIEELQRSGNVAIVLVTPCQPNPLWKHTSGMIGEYAEVLRRLGNEYGVGVADAYAIWQHALDAGKTPESLLANNINHPNDYGHWLYYTAFEALINR